MMLLLILRRIQRPTTQGHSSYSSSCAHARARHPLIEAVRFAESLRKLSQSSDIKKNMDQ